MNLIYWNLIQASCSLLTFIPSYSRIIWELAIAFSPKKSETAERRLGMDRGEGDGVVGGRIYSEMIRVWDIVLDHDQLHTRIQNIIRSHSRGEQCIIQKKLKGLERKQFSKYIKRRVPVLYSEIEDEQIARPQQYYPPASANDTEYHIMKFYSFSASLVNSILLHQSTKVTVCILQHRESCLERPLPVKITCLERP